MFQCLASISAPLPLYPLWWLTEVTSPVSHVIHPKVNMNTNVSFDITLEFDSDIRLLSSHVVCPDWVMSRATIED